MAFCAAAAAAGARAHPREGHPVARLEGRAARASERRAAVRLRQRALPGEADDRLRPLRHGHRAARRRRLRMEVGRAEGWLAPQVSPQRNREITRTFSQRCFLLEALVVIQVLRRIRTLRG